MGKDFKSIEAALQYIQNVAIPQALKENVSVTAKEQIQESVENIVYDAYNPDTYWRRRDMNKGLGDITQINGAMNGNNELIMTDDAPFNPENTDGTYSPDGEDGEIETGEIDMSKSLAYNIEYGWGTQSTPYSEPRRFMDDATEKLNSGLAKESMKKGLEKILGKGVIS